MKVVIPEWQGRVSPVFDAARHLQIFEIEADHARPILDVACDAETESVRVAQLTQTGAAVLICGAISQPLESAITSAGIQVIAQICGYVEDVAEAYAKGHLTRETFLMPGCGRRHRRCRRRYG